ncbi:hypothetical protein WA158_005353 [Blastocystis sp. Blastoise]
MNTINKTIEIEQKFKYNLSTLLPQLNSIHAIYIGKKTFIDKYYDTTSLFLLNQNIYLRNRASIWETKEGLHIKDHSYDKTVKSTIFKETEGNDKVIIELNRFFNEKNLNSLTVEEFIHHHNMNIYAIIETTRTTYQINDHTKIDLDEAKLFDTNSDNYTLYSLGEIEIMTTDKNQKSIVEKEIHSIRNSLNIEQYDITKEPLPSKLDQYLVNILSILIIHRYLHDWKKEIFYSNQFKYLN